MYCAQDEEKMEQIAGNGKRTIVPIESWRDMSCWTSLLACLCHLTAASSGSSSSSSRPESLQLETHNAGASRALSSVKNKLQGNLCTHVPRVVSLFPHSDLLRAGMVESDKLSVEGQVQYLISEATSATNLSRMYHGWAPWL